MSSTCPRSCGPCEPCHRAGCRYDVQIGVGNKAGRDSDMEITRSTVRGGWRAWLGFGNSAGRDQVVKVAKNDIRGCRGGVQLGVDNEADRDMNIAVSDNNIRP